MAVDGFAPRRRVIAWFRSAPPPASRTAFEERGFGVSEWQESHLQSDAVISGATAVVFTQRPAPPTEIANDLARYAQRLLDFDCNIIVHHLPGVVRPIANVANDKRLPIDRLPTNEVPDIAREIRKWQRVTGDLPRPHLRLYPQGFPWAEIANYEMEHPAGPAPDPNVRVVPSRGTEVDGAVGVLVRRAFHDCGEVHLTPIPGGRSGAKVFIAHAEVRGRWSLPYFVKTGSRGKILDEYRGYEQHVDAFVPFHLGPSLDNARCGLGAHDGVLVGNFVEGSENLVDCARQGRAGPALACLFERTLRGWHRDGKPRSARFRGAVATLGPHLGVARWSRARELGATRSPYKLLRTFRACGPSPMLWGHTHGDLHASNVRVRGAEAIVIDFLQCGEGPILADPAALEASLFVEALEPIVHQDPAVAQAAYAARFEAWRVSTDPLYSADAIGVLPSHIQPKDEWAWFHSCVRQIRMYAFHMERARGQYALALAAALLFKSGKNQRAGEPERSTRALAYLYGERLLLATAPLFPLSPPQAAQVAP